MVTRTQQEHGRPFRPSTLVLNLGYHSFFPSSSCWRVKIFKKLLPGVDEFSFLMEDCDDKNLGRIFNREGHEWKCLKLKFVTCKCVFQLPEYHKFENFPKTLCDVQVCQIIQQIIWREIKLKEIKKIKSKQSWINPP